MRIAQVAPLYEPVPPTYYGGTERVVSGVTEELVRRGHEVVLFASGDSRTNGELVPCCPRSLRLDSSVKDPLAHNIVQFEMVIRRAHEFDIIHNHTDFIAFPTARLLGVPMLHTLHGRLDIPDLLPVYTHYPDLPLVSISDAQRGPLPHAGWVSTVYNGIPLDRFRFQERPGTYLVFLGRISPEKGIEQAIEIAGRVGMPLKVAAKVDPLDRAYYSEKIKPLFRNSRVEYLGEIDDGGKDALLGGALAYLFPINWPEPFGITMVEAMACGTPVIAMARGSVPEIVAHGQTGFVCRSLAEMISAVPQVERLSRIMCRRHVKDNFSTELMVDGYEAAYGAVLSQTSQQVMIKRRSHAAALEMVRPAAAVTHHLPANPLSPEPATPLARDA